LGRRLHEWVLSNLSPPGLKFRQKYLVPALSPPDQTQLQEAQDALTSKYDEAAALLEQIKADAEATKASVLAQQEKVDKSMAEVQEAVSAFKIRDQERSEELRSCKEEVDSLKEQLPKVRSASPSPIN
jgi:peroxin-14